MDLAELFEDPVNERATMARFQLVDLRDVVRLSDPEDVAKSSAPGSSPTSRPRRREQLAPTSSCG
jgi:hypothetical protein